MARFADVYGQVAQLVEQWTENPCVAGSIPALPTKRKPRWLLLKTQVSQPGFLLGVFFGATPGLPQTGIRPHAALQPALRTCGPPNHSAGRESLDVHDTYPAAIGADGATRCTAPLSQLPQRRQHGPLGGHPGAGHTIGGVSSEHGSSRIQFCNHTIAYQFCKHATG